MIRLAVLSALLSATFTPSWAAPVLYGFTTFATGTLPGDSSSSSVSGTFAYDSSAPAVGSLPNGSAIYGIPAITGLTGIVAGRSFSDPGGPTVVGNDVGAMPGADFLQLLADPAIEANATPRNLSGFATGGYTLANVRMFWIEGDTTPELIPDFLSSNAMPSALPSFHGRLALDFVPPGAMLPIAQGDPVLRVFFNGLTVTPVPEPATTALLLAGLAGFRIAARRRPRADPAQKNLRLQSRSAFL